ncbi:MAG: DNA polymerase [Lachnospirales bacterium]
MDSLGKKEVAEVLKIAPPLLAEVLELRQQIAKLSVKKYTAMQNAVCKDNRVRGMFQFYGANRTGRFAGRIVQLQNLPQNYISDLPEARELIKHGHFDAVNFLYDNPSSVLLELIRTTFVPPTTQKFIVSDFSAIEARVIAWLSN